MKGRWSHTETHIRTTTSLQRWSVFLRPLNHQGYTITEVLIFLAVTMGIFVMIAGSVGGQQRRAEFNTAARDMESAVQDVANDITTGFYNNAGNFVCREVAGAPVISIGTAAQGTNNDCILVGRVAHFVNSSVPDPGRSFTAYSVAGVRQFNAPFIGLRDVESYSEARPRAIEETMETYQMPPGLRVTSMYIEGGSRIHGVGFFTTFDAGASDPSSLTVNIIPMVGNDTSSMVGRINNPMTYATTSLNPAEGVVLCMDGEGVDRHALLRIGSNNSRLTTNLIIGDDTCASVGYPA